MNWWERGEWSDERGDASAPPDSSTQGGSDVVGADQSVAAMEQAPLGEPLSDFDVRSVYDSRPVNAYDFNFTQSVVVAFGTTASWSATFDVPNGYRAVPLDWSVTFIPTLVNNGGSSSSFYATRNLVSIQQNNAALPNNANIVIGASGTNDDIETFFICEENTTFGIAGTSLFSASGPDTVYAIIHVHGNLIPVSEVALPFAIANRKFGT